MLPFTNKARHLNTTRRTPKTPLTCKVRKNKANSQTFCHIFSFSLHFCFCVRAQRDGNVQFV